MSWLALALTAQPAEARWLIIEEPGDAIAHNVLDGVLAGLGEPFDVKTGAQVAALTADTLFNTYEVVYIGVGDPFPSVTSANVSPLISGNGVVEQYVALGGILFVHGAHNDPRNTNGPGGSQFRAAALAGQGVFYDNQALIIDGNHEFILGTFANGITLTNNDFFNWNSTCHGVVDPPPGYLSSGGVNLGTNPVDSEWNEILFSPASNDSAMIEYTYGCGYVSMDMMTFDWDGSPLREALVDESAKYIHGIQGNFPFCNQDSDGDGLLDSDDNCPNVSNPQQEDADLDGLGDACDDCNNLTEHDDDNDGVCDPVDICLGFDDKLDTDSDTVPDGCDVCPGFDDFLDTDLDLLADGCDACPLDPAGADDDDGDSVCNSDDRCPLFDDYLDTDGDQWPDGCDNCPKDSNPAQADGDFDGYGATCDCDDTDSAVRPGGIELCNGIDDDCDGATDEAGAVGPVQWFEDLDDDGQGAAGTLVNGCTQPDHTSTNDLDCDDANPLVYVGAQEWCDGRDTDCDGVDDAPGICPEPTGPPAHENVASCGSCSSGGSPSGVAVVSLALAASLLRRRRRSP